MVKGSLESSYCRLLALRFDVIAAVLGFKYFNEIFILFVDWLLAKAAVLKIVINEWGTQIKRFKNGTQVACTDDHSKMGPR